MLCVAVAAVVCGACAPPQATERARALVRVHQEDKALATLRERLSAHPEDVEARRLLIRLLGFTGDLTQAQAEVEALSRWLAPGDPSPYLELGHARELAHQYDEALAAYDEAARVAPSSPEGPREGGMRCARWGELQPAASRLEEAVHRGAHDAEVWHVLGLVRVGLGDYDGAERAYAEGTASNPRAASNWLGLASVAVARGDAERALKAYGEVLARVPKFADAELGRAWALARLGRKEEARQALDRAQELGAPRANLSSQRAALDAPSTP